MVITVKMSYRHTEGTVYYMVDRLRPIAHLW